MKQVAPGFYLETAYSPYNLSMIVTRLGAIVVDLPPNQDDALHWLDEVRVVSKTLRYLVLTNASLERQLTAGFTQLPVITTYAMMQMLNKYRDERARRDLIAALLTHFPDQADVINVFDPPKPALVFAQSCTLHEVGTELIFETVEGAVPGSLWIRAPGVKVLISGETIAVEDVPPVYETPDSKAWLNTLATVSTHHSVQTIIPGRGKRAISRADVERQREFLRVMRRTARNLAHRNEKTTLTRAAEDLGQVFYNDRGAQAVRAIRRGLEHLVSEAASTSTHDDSEETGWSQLRWPI